MNVHLRNVQAAGVKVFSGWASTAVLLVSISVATNVLREVFSLIGVLTALVKSNETKTKLVERKQ
jgi:hypothetical protein